MTVFSSFIHLNPHKELKLIFCINVQKFVLCLNIITEVRLNIYNMYYGHFLWYIVKKYLIKMFEQ